MKRYEESKTPVIIHFVNIDNFNRPVFKDNKRNFYGATDILFPYETRESEVLEKVTEKDLTFFGRKFNCEPMGTEVNDIRIERKSTK